MGEKVLPGPNFDWKKEIKHVYYTCKEPGSYYGPVKLYSVLKKKDRSCTLSEVKKWMEKQDVYNLHRSRKGRFERRKLVRLRPFETLSADIVFLQDLAKYNSNYSYILTVICLFSNKAWSFPLKRKTKIETSEALEKIFNELQGDVDNFFVDQGVEFDLDIYEKYNINKYSVKSPLKSCHVENFNKILENRLFRAMTANSSLRWLNYLDEIIDSYNNTPIKRLYNFSPNEAIISPNKEYLKEKFKHERALMHQKYAKRKIDIKVGDFVRTVKPKSTFSRGYKVTFFDKVRKLTKILPTAPPTFRVSGLERSYYRSELAPTCEPSVEKEQHYYISKDRCVGGRELRSKVKVGQEKEFLIKSYNDKNFEEWISEHELQRLDNDKLLCHTAEWG